MSVLMLVIAVMFSVLVSNIASRFIPKVSTPIVQIALGVAWFMIPSTPLLEIDSELFMTLFIAPLLFLEARNMSRSSLNRNIKQCLSLAVGLVLLSVVIIGFSLHMIWPAIPLATAFALGAALGPTDAVAVTSIGRECGLPKRIMAILRGECLFNDAASIVSFEFATAAATGYSFSAGKFAQSISYNFI
ncbi:MAG: cation:proton antiporter, partial [Bifidobacteriaceae bacterium]|nr:cation:proton antiporter [Bifidobacteriaceae bacterium]